VTTERITDIIEKVNAGEAAADDRLTSALYSELRRIAANQLRRERPDHTLQPTALVHEVYFYLRRHRDKRWENRAHFLGTAARVMRNILVDHARQKCAAKRGSQKVHLPLEDLEVLIGENPQDFLEVNEALERLCKMSSFDCKVVEMRYIAGLTVEESAEILGVSTQTVKRSRKRAKAWLIAELTSGR